MSVLSQFRPTGGTASGDLSNLPVYQELAASSNQVLDLSQYSVFEIKPTADITISTTGLSTTGSSAGFLSVINGGDQNVTFGAEVKWEGGSPALLSPSTGNRFDLSTSGYDSVSFSVASEDAKPRGIAFNNDGTKMYMVGPISDSVHQYTLSTAFDLSTAGYDSVSFSVASEEGLPYGLAFNNDGTKMYMVGPVSGSVHQYSLSTAFDLSTASYDNVSFSVASEETEPRDIVFNNDGTKMYISGNSNDSVYQYSLSTAFDLSTAGYDSVSFSVASEEANPYGLAFNNDGTKMYVVGPVSDSVHQYTLSTAFDLSTAGYDSVSFSVASEEGSPTDLAFNNDGTKMYVVGPDSDSVHQYTTGVESVVIDALDVIQLTQYSTDQVLAKLLGSGISL